MKKRFHWRVASSFAVGAQVAMPTAAYAEAAASPNVVNVVATEFMFDMPDSIPAGPTLFRLSVSGK